MWSRKVEVQPKLKEVLQLMEANLEEPLPLQDLAEYVQLSRRQLERLFLKHLHSTPSRYYLKLRLDRARRLLKQTSRSIVEITAMCGFVSTTHFSRCYRKTLGHAPKYERMEVYSQGLGPAGNVLTDTMASLPSSSLQALRRARTEPTYGTFEDTGSG